MKNLELALVCGIIVTLTIFVVIGAIAYSCISHEVIKEAKK